MQIYTLRSKDTLSALSARFGVPVCMIMRANSSVSMRPGAKLRIPPIDFCDKGGIPQYIVKKGETLLDIAKAHGTTPIAIMRENALSPSVQLREGEALSIPAPPENTKIYICKATDTLEGLSRQFGVKPELLRALNPGVTQVYAGAQIFVPLAF